jgi:hypothetical protein
MTVTLRIGMVDPGTVARAIVSTRRSGPLWKTAPGTSTGGAVVVGSRACAAGGHGGAVIRVADSSGSGGWR